MKPRRTTCDRPRGESSSDAASKAARLIAGRFAVAAWSLCAAAGATGLEPAPLHGSRSTQDGGAPLGAAEEWSAADGPARVWALIEARCTPCHAPSGALAASEPRAIRKWPGATTLSAVVETAVVAGDPAESDLFLAIEYDEMPPSDAAQPALSEAEKALVRDWILAGAPLPLPDTLPPHETLAPSVTATPSGPGPAAPPDTLELVGRFHPLVVHFPIALLLAAVPAALLGRLRRGTDSGARAAWCADYCAAIGAAGAVAASALGWCAHEAGAGALHPDLLERHEWSGFAAAFLALAAVGAARAARRGHRFGRFHLPLLIAAAAVVSFAGHIGGMLVWGEDFLPLPF
ncbi:MAG: DUF2231 domain-containing protein [Planctomycetota bacterium]